MVELVARWTQSQGFTPPMRGRFTNGIGTLIGDDVMDGRRVQSAFTVVPDHGLVVSLGASRIGGWGCELGNELGGRV